MSSILTNNGAMVALQTLKDINSKLAQTQNQISTGKSINSAKDNAAIWAISKTMESDVAAFKTIDQTLALGESTVAVARAAAQSITDTLTKIRTKVIAAQEAGTSAEDRAKYQKDIDAMKNEIASAVSSAQFSGKNLINGSTSSPMKIMSSLDRSIDGDVAVGTIDVQTVDLRTSGTGSTVVGPSGSATATDGGGAVTVGTLSFQGGGTAIAATDGSADASDGTALLAGDVITLDLGGTEITYTIQAGDSMTEIVSGLDAAKTGASIAGTLSSTGDQLTFDNGTGGGDMAVTLSTERTAGGDGGLAALAGLDVSAEGGPADALNAIEGLIKVAVDAAASFGSSQGRIETQRDFIGKLTDSMRSGIGALVDANMEEASARLQVLQVQQQLATQSLSIANQAPQALLSLFR
ncbi:flagellin [Paracoccus aerodenitrificans]|uniref:flagellin n=1 Tax=Paracoccus aerodenitrificans TaxID=3017781 RepID=UPI0022F10760|nr:flagellin [Paracoccus aerodenitrificans]WBU64302.1 flagellin [Paracoccus aerodenitrificans]